MAYFVNFSSKFERAVRALLIVQNKATWDSSYVSNDDRTDTRTLPNRTFVVSGYSPQRTYRPEGTCALEIQHHFSAALQPGQPQNSLRVAMESFLGDTLDTLNLGGADDSANTKLAAAITAAGRWLAQTDNTQRGNEIAANNSDMANFRCDWVKFETPMITRGKDTATLNWVEIVHITGFCSHATS